MTLFRTLLLLSLLATSASAQNATGIKTANLRGANLNLMTNHDPAVEESHFDLLPGYEVNLFAAEPMLANPIHMVWDSRGRLWVACSWAYPQIKPGEAANDKVIILEDTDGDGRADTSTVFADGLYIPTGIELANGGCYVAQSPDVFFLKDTDGDDVADVKELALTGFGIEDSHHSISAWRRGPGGWLYFQEGIFLHTQVETQYGVVRNFNGGVYQFHPRTQELRMFARIGVGNPWGHVFDRWGQSFFIDNPRVSYLTPSTGNGTEKVRIAQLISTEKQCGGDIASGTHLPEDIRGQLLTCRFKSRAIIRYELLEKGAGYSANVLKPLIASRHPNFRPVDCKMGPDGAVYVADWYNSIINHAQHNFRDPRRDHEHGRIWRITAKGRPLVQKPKLVGEPISQLLNHLKSPEAWIRHQARLELSEREPELVERAVVAWAAKLDASDPDHDHHLVEALWACQNVDQPNETILKRVLAAGNGRARAAGARVIRYWHASLDDPIALTEVAAADPFPRVRMEAVLSAGFIPHADAFPAALIALDYEQDSFIETALPQTVAALEPYWRPALESGVLTFSKAAHLAFVEKKAGIGFEKRLKTFLKQKTHTTQDITFMRAQLVEQADIRQLRGVVNSLARTIPAETAIEFSVGMLEALHQYGLKSKESLGRKVESLQKFLNARNDAIAAGVADVLGVWRADRAAAALAKVLRDPQRAPQVRQSAAIALGRLGRPEYIKTLRDLASAGPVADRYIALQGLAIPELEEAAGLAASLFRDAPGQADPVPLVKVFLTRDKGVGYLSAAMASVEPDDAVVGRMAEFHRQTGQLPRRLAEVFTPRQSGSLSAALITESRAGLTADVNRLGDPARGEMVYRRKALACASCHAVGAAGPTIGPNLVAVGGAATTEYMVESILEPNKSIAEHYENNLVRMRDGQVRMGVITFRSEKELALHDSAVGQEIRIPTASIRKITPMPSLMPAGLADQLHSRQEFLDLAKFLSVLGRPGPYANDERPVIRKWRVAPAADVGSLPGEDTIWTPAYAMVDGTLPDVDLNLGSKVFARGFINVQVPGEIQLDLNHTEGVQLWVDEQKIDDPSAAFAVRKGRRSFTFAIDRDKRGDAGLRVECRAAPTSNAKLKPEGGI